MTGGRIVLGVAAGLATLTIVACGSSASEESGSTGSTTQAADGPSASVRPEQDSRPELVTVPKLVGESFDDAVRDVRKAGLEHQSPGFPGTVGNPRNEGSCLTVLSQAPPPGTRLRGGDIVSIIFGACRSVITEGRLSND
jgi:hypothetical protein